METFQNVAFSIVAGGEPAKYPVRDSKMPKHWRYQCDLSGLHKAWVSIAVAGLPQDSNHIAKEVFRVKPENSKFFTYWIDELVSAPGVGRAEPPPAVPSPAPSPRCYSLHEEIEAIGKITRLLIAAMPRGPADIIVVEGLKAIVARDGIERMCNQPAEPQEEKLPPDEEIPF